MTIKSGADDGYSPASSNSATKSSAPLRDIPQSVNVIPQQLLRDQAARSMEDALRNVPGVVFSSGDGQRDQVIIRGFSAISDQFIDGVRDDALYFRDLSNIDRIEVLKGPPAVLYGRGSSGGLINRVTKKPRFGETFGEAVLSLGSHKLRRLEGDYNMAVSETAAFRLNLAREDSGSYRDQQFVDRYSFAPSLALKLGAQTGLLLQYSKARDQRVTDFGIPALNGRPVDVPASTYYGSGNARRDDTTPQSGRLVHRNTGSPLRRCLQRPQHQPVLHLRARPLQHASGRHHRSCDTHCRPHPKLHPARRIELVQPDRFDLQECARWLQAGMAAPEGALNEIFGPR